MIHDSQNNIFLIECRYDSNFIFLSNIIQRDGPFIKLNVFLTNVPIVLSNDGTRSQNLATG